MRTLILLGLLLPFAAFAQDALPPLPEKPEDAPEAYRVFLQSVKEAQKDQLADQKMTFMGIGLGESDPEISKAIGLPSTIGVRVMNVQEGTPANKAGFKVNDMLVKFEDQHLFNRQQLTALVQLKKPGEVVEIGVVRMSKYLTVKLTLGSRPFMRGDRERIEGKPFDPNQEVPQQPQRPEKPIKPFGDNEF